jgi:hypothetical protein
LRPRATLRSAAAACSAATSAWATVSWAVVVASCVEVVDSCASRRRLRAASAEASCGKQQQGRSIHQHQDSIKMISCGGGCQQDACVPPILLDTTAIPALAAALCPRLCQTMHPRPHALCTAGTCHPLVMPTRLSALHPPLRSPGPSPAAPPGPWCAPPPAPAQHAQHASQRTTPEHLH